MQLIANDLDVRPFPGQHFLRRFGDRLSERVILIDQIDLPGVCVLRNRVGQRRHFHIGIGIEAEVPEAAPVVGERRIDGAGV